MDPNLVIWFRVGQDNAEEFQVAKETLEGLPISVVRYRDEIPDNSLVIPRYSVLPFYEDTERELLRRNIHLINSYEQFRYLEEMEWARDLAEWTPQTWFPGEYGLIPDEGSFVVKGKINSRKWDWNRRMFAPTKADIRPILESLLDDSLISEQGVVVRLFERFQKLDEGLNGLPIINEWRLFFFGEHLFDYCFYWSILDEEEIPWHLPGVIRKLGNSLAKQVSRKLNFFTLDLAIRENGEARLIEVNDGQMSGLNSCGPGEYYQTLWLSLALGKGPELIEEIWRSRGNM